MRKFRKWFLMVLILVIGWNVGYGKQLEKVGSPSPKRIVYLKIVAEDSFTSRFGWMQFIGEIVETTSEEFEKQLGIKLEIKKIERMKNLPEPLEENRIDINPENCDIIIGFSYKVSVHYTGCVDKILGRYALITHYDYYKYGDHVDYRLTVDRETVAVFIHEVGHLFGAKHTKDDSSVMCEDAYRFYSFKFDEKNKKRILKRKWRNFKK